MKLFPTRHPDRLKAEHPILVEEFQRLDEAGRTEALHQLIELVADLTLNGLSSPYLRALTGSPLFELRPNTRGGVRGGCRVYLFFAAFEGQEVAGLVNCEVKDGTKASTEKLNTALAVCIAARRGINVFRRAGS